MPSKLSKAVTSATGVPASDADIINAARADMPPATRDMLPMYEKGKTFEPWGHSFVSNPDVYNDYLNSAAIKYGKVFAKTSVAKNPLTFFKRGTMPFGGKIEAWIHDVIEPKMYRPDLVDGAENPFAVNFGRVEARTYIQKEDIESRNTFIDTQDTMFLQNATQFNNFLFGKVSALVNGAILNEFSMGKLTLATSLVNGKITTETANDVSDLQEKIVLWSTLLQYFDRGNNSLGINNATLVDDLVAIIPARAAVKLDMKYLANVINAELAGVNIKTLQIDRFPDVWTYDSDHQVTQDDIDKGFINPREYKPGDVIKAGALAQENATGATQKLNGDKVGAIILDRDAYQMWDQLPLTLSTIANPAKRYNNLFINKSTYHAFIEGLNCKAIMLADDFDITK